MFKEFSFQNTTPSPSQNHTIWIVYMLNGTIHTINFQFSSLSLQIWIHIWRIRLQPKSTITRLVPCSLPPWPLHPSCWAWAPSPRCPASSSAARGSAGCAWPGARSARCPGETNRGFCFAKYWILNWNWYWISEIKLDSCWYWISEDLKDELMLWCLSSMGYN